MGEQLKWAPSFKDWDHEKNHNFLLNLILFVSIVKKCLAQEITFSDLNIHLSAHFSALGL